MIFHSLDCDKEMIENCTRENFLTEKAQKKNLFDLKWPSGRFSRLCSGGALFYCVVHLHKYDLHGRFIRRKAFLHPHHNIQHQKFVKVMQLWKSCEQMKLKWNFLATMSRGMFGEKTFRVKNFMKRKPLQLLNTRVDRSCFNLVLQPVAHGTSEEWIQLNTSRFWKHHICL